MRVVLLGMLTSCASRETRIEGGTEEQRAIVAAALDEITSAASFPVSVPRIDIREMSRGDGRYNSVTRRIRLRPVADDELATNTRHELCHALDLQAGLESPTDPVWAFRSDEQREAYGERRGRREAFATVCSAGPHALALVGGCTPEGADLRDVFDALFDHVPAADSTATLRSTVTLPSGSELTSARGTTGGLVWLSFETAGGQDERWIDPETGLDGPPQGLTVGFDPLDENARAAFETAVPAVWSTDPEAFGVHAVGRMSWRMPIEPTARALFAWDGATLTTWCNPGDDGLLVVGDTLWIAAQRGDVVELRQTSFTR
ncbi:MAG: hypothetical protein R3F61_24325 [Myxococcota bacterium]